jgi:transposase
MNKVNPEGGRLLVSHSFEEFTMYFIGMDVSKKTLDLAYFDHQPKRWSKPCILGNSPKGWDVLTQWAEKQIQAPHEDICIVMEATGVYHLKVAAFLSREGLNVTVVNPQQASQYAKSQNHQNKSDKLDARALQEYGSQLKKYHLFTPDTPEISQLKALLSRTRQLGKDLQRERNRLEKCDFQEGSSWARTSIERLIGYIISEQKRTQTQIDQLIKQNDVLKHNQKLLCTIKGIGKLTSQWLLPLLSTQRFKSARETAAFIGLVPCHKSSGTSLRTRGRLSGRGDADLRARLYMPAVCAMTYDPAMKAFYQQLVAKGKPSKVALTAVMRKLVHICYGVIKHQTPYIENYAA